MHELSENHNLYYSQGHFSVARLKKERKKTTAVWRILDEQTGELFWFSLITALWYS